MSKPIRVLQVFARMDRGGAETMIMNIYRNIDRSKIQFDFIVHTNEECAYDAEIAELGGKILRFPRYVGKNHFNYVNRWKWLFNTYPEYKIIHGHVRSTATIYLSIAKRYGLITISHSHSTSSGTGISAFVKDVYQFPIRYIADYLFACSKTAGEWLFGKDVIRKKNFFIIKNAIETRKYIFNKDVRTQKRNELDIKNRLVIGHIGRFNKSKNHFFLIDLFSAIHQKKQDAVLLLVGDGELRKYVELKVKKLGLSDSVIFTGIRSDVPELLQAMDIFLFPSLYEGLPVTLIEAQAAGLPCVVSNRITKEVKITDAIKFVALEDKIECWVENIFSMFNNYRRENNYKYVVDSGYDIQATTKWIEEFYKDILEDFQKISDNRGSKNEI